MSIRSSMWLQVPALAGTGVLLIDRPAPPTAQRTGEHCPGPAEPFRSCRPGVTETSPPDRPASAAQGAARRAAARGRRQTRQCRAAQQTPAGQCLSRSSCCFLPRNPSRGCILVPVADNLGGRGDTEETASILEFIGSACALLWWACWPARWCSTGSAARCSASTRDPRGLLALWSSIYGDAVHLGGAGLILLLGPLLMFQIAWAGLFAF